MASSPMNIKNKPNIKSERVLPELHPAGKMDCGPFAPDRLERAVAGAKNRIVRQGQNILAIGSQCIGVGNAPPPIRTGKHGVPNYPRCVWQPRNNIRDPPAGMSAGWRVSIAARQLRIFSQPRMIASLMVSNPQTNAVALVDSLSRGEVGDVIRMGMGQKNGLDRDPLA